MRVGSIPFNKILLVLMSRLWLKSRLEMIAMNGQAAPLKR
jgi:hypothetical protein